MKLRFFSLLLSGLGATLLAAAGRAGVSDPVSPDLPEYVAVSGVAGTLDSIGSDSLNNLLTLWAEAFRERYPNVNIQIEGKGSSTAPPALIQGTAQIGPMSRAMKPTELDAFEQRHGYPPTAVPVAIDALALYVHKDNPLEALTLAEVDAIFSSTLRRGQSPLHTWGELGLDGDWRQRRISLYGRNSASGTYGFFKAMALAKGDFRPTMKEQPGSSAVVQGVSSDLYGIGVSGIGYRTSGVKVLALGESRDALFEATYENCLSQDYVLARVLYLYVNKAPGQPLDPLTREFLRFVHSREGQAIVQKDGYFPLNAAIVAQAQELLVE